VNAVFSRARHLKNDRNKQEEVLSVPESMPGLLTCFTNKKAMNGAADFIGISQSPMTQRMSNQSNRC
jgi:hypothetical protein